MEWQDERKPEVFCRRVYIGAPAEGVWEWLVEPERVEQYHLAMLEARPAAVGDPVRLLNKLTWQPVATGVVEELAEGRRLVYSFDFVLEDPDPVSRVSLELIPYGEAMCCLELRHEGLFSPSETFNSVSRSWDVVLSSLKTIAETGKTLPWPSRRRG